MTRQLRPITFVLLKAAEGGQTIAEAVRRAKQAGARSVVQTDCAYVGHFALEITATKAAFRKIENVLYGR